MADIEEKSNKNILGTKSRMMSAFGKGISSIFQTTLSAHMENNTFEPKMNEHRFDQGSKTMKHRHSVDYLASSNKKQAPQVSQTTNLIEDRNERLEHLKLLQNQVFKEPQIKQNETFSLVAKYLTSHQPAESQNTPARTSESNRKTLLRSPFVGMDTPMSRRNQYVGQGTVARQEKDNERQQ